jgi:hypothetical protein
MVRPSPSGVKPSGGSLPADRFDLLVVREDLAGRLVGEHVVA